MTTAGGSGLAAVEESPTDAKRVPLRPGLEVLIVDPQGRDEPVQVVVPPQNRGQVTREGNFDEAPTKGDTGDRGARVVPESLPVDPVQLMAGGVRVAAVVLQGVDLQTVIGAIHGTPTHRSTLRW
jgi:hypothetical protein